MLRKSPSLPADTIIYDLEDSVAPAQKIAARHALCKFLKESARENTVAPERIAVRINAIDTPFFEDDLRALRDIPTIHSLVLPKVHSSHYLDTVSSALSNLPRPPLHFIASIESARALWSVGEIASWTSQHGRHKGGTLAALLFAAEDYCADSAVIRTPSGFELLYTRSRIVVAARTFGLHAIDMVCVNYKDAAYLKNECEDGRRLGFDGKQAIHPNQVDTINSTFVPTAKQIHRAATIIHRMAHSHTSEQRGAFGLDLGDGKGGMEMIDAPMLKQAENTIRIARAAGLEIPSVE